MIAEAQFVIVLGVLGPYLPERRQARAAYTSISLAVVLGLVAWL